ncbi:PKD domain-containing protein [Methanocalculus chunghsingensis]|uniref:PKD domain-containing protein n=1 Tax=Methanocalculus chunghsingensis TaxID=156457 RepID=UPI001B8C6330|nr:PKD domain-containing protein [Methanocalculus chunghsingensis]
MKPAVWLLIIIVSLLLVPGGSAVLVSPESSSGSSYEMAFIPAEVTAGTGDSIDVTLKAITAPNGLIGFNISFYLDNPDVGEIVEVIFPSWVDLRQQSSLPGDEVWCRGADLGDGPGGSDITVLTLRIRADAPGMTGIRIRSGEGYLDDAAGYREYPPPISALLHVGSDPGPTPTPEPTPIPTPEPTPSPQPDTSSVLLAGDEDELSVGQTAVYTVVMENADQGISGYNITGFVSDSSVLEITSVSFPSWANMPEHGPLPAESVWCKAVDLAGDSGTGEVALVMMTVRAVAPGEAGIGILEGHLIDDRQGGLYCPALQDRSITVKEMPPPPQADFFVNQTEGIIPFPVTLTDRSTGTVDAWLWDFGDGTTSSEQHPVHVYQDPGTYSISLTVTNAGGEDHIITDSIITAHPPPPSAAFDADIREGNAPLSISFSDLSSGTIDEWHWMFGDGGESTLENPVYSYTTPGIYTVSLMVRNGGGSDTITKSDYINLLRHFPKPQGGFFPKPQDMTGDRLYEDLDGNGRIGFNDVILFYENIEVLRLGDFGQIELFDYDGNGRIGFNDVVVLYEMV